MSDDRIEVNLQDIPTSDWPPAGPHTAKVVKIEMQDSKSTPGAKMLYWEFEVQTEGGEKYRRVWTNTSLQPQALWKLRDLVNACGVFPSAEGFNKSECLGRLLKIWITHEEYQGKTMAKVDDYAPIG